MKYFAFLLIPLFALTACDQEPASLNPDQPYKRITFEDVKATAAERAACEAVGGIVRPAGKLQADHCIQNLPDAGKECQDAADCLGRCILEGPEVDRIKPGTAVTGVCESTDEHFGCTTLVNGGVVEGTLCVD